MSVTDLVLETKIIEAIRTVYDPEIPVNIHDLGLIYNIDIQPGGKVKVDMTLTAPACPAAETLPPEVEQKVRDIPEVTEATVTVVWDPPWSPEKMSEAAKLELNMW